MSSEGKINLALIEESDVALRSVNRQSEDYLKLVDSIRKNGVLNSITVRRKDEGVGFILVDGLQRFTSAKDAGLEEIPANIIECQTDIDVLNAQIIANIHKIVTHPVEYSRQLLRILAASPLMTIRELAGNLSQSEAWVNQRLGLVKLDPKIGELVDNDKINLSNAYALAKLPIEEQASYVDRAMTDPPTTFVPTVHARVKEIRDATRQGREAGPAVFQPVAHLQKLSAIKDEMDSPTIGLVVCNREGATTVLQAWNAAMKWVLNLDSASVDAQRTKDEERKAKATVEKEKRAKERDSKKSQEAAAKAAELTSI